MPCCDFTSTAGLQLSTALLKSFSESWRARSSIAWRASYMIRSAVLFLPPYIIMFTNFATSRLPCLGSGRISRRAAPARRILGGSLGLLGAVLRSALPPPGHPRGVQRAADDVVPDARQVLHTTAPDEHDRVLLQVVPDPGDVRRHLEAIGQADPRDLAQGRVRLLRRGGVDPDAHPALLGTGLHGGRLRLLPHRLAALPHQLIDRRHDSPGVLLTPSRARSSARSVFRGGPSLGPKP